MATIAIGESLGPPYPKRMKRKVYEKELNDLQIELLKMQRWVKESGERIVIIFEGRDAAGKGGAIKRFREHLNPRGAPHIALGTPSDTEQGQWYFQRYVNHLPTYGEIIFFDRSWYNRAGVEIVMGFCTTIQYAEFMRQAPELENSLINSGIRLFKLWFAVDEDEQRRRFDARRIDPLKRWKLSTMDEASLDKWDEYTKARQAMFQFTNTVVAPWTVVNSNEKRRARLNSIRHVLHELPYDEKDPEIACPPDPKVVGPAFEMFEQVRVEL